jgi:putative endonuclease
MSGRNQVVGQWGEAIAAQYLEEKGCEVLDRNVRTPYGELDLVVRQGEQIVFVEVKTRRGTLFGMPEAAVDQRKQARLLASAQHYLQSKQEILLDWRVDVIAILGHPEAGVDQIMWFENAVSS